MRLSQRANNELRPIEIIQNYTKHAEGSVLIKCGDTHVLCTASVEENVPSFLKGKNHIGANLRNHKNLLLVLFSIYIFSTFVTWYYDRCNN